MSRQKYQLYKTDTSFDHRNFFLLLVTGFFVTKLIFFPESIASSFPDAYTPAMTQYLQRRGWYMLLTAMLYIYSYYRNCCFEAVAFVIFEVAICNMVGDFVNVYSKFTNGTVPVELIFFGIIRFAATVCLFLNTFNSHRAPLPPRRLWPSLKNHPASES